MALHAQAGTMNIALHFRAGDGHQMTLIICVDAGGIEGKDWWGAVARQHQEYQVPVAW